MRLSGYEKSFQNKIKGISRSNNKRIQLPYINKTIDFTQNAQNSNYQSSLNFLEKFSWTQTNKNYELLSQNQIYKQYKQLRKQIFNINELVAKQLERMQRKAERKKLVTQIQPQKMNQIREKQIENNICILSRMKKQYKGLKAKSQNVRTKQDVQNQIENTKSQISSVKQKINSLKLKNKGLGDSIINTDQVLIQLRDQQLRLQTWMKKKKQLVNKMQRVKQETQKVEQSLKQINNSSSLADNYMKKDESAKKSIQDRKLQQEKYNQKNHYIQVVRKNHEIFSGLKQQKYHQFLKQLESHVQKDQQIKVKMRDTQYKTLEYSDQIKLLETKLKQLKLQAQKSFFNNFSNDNCSENSFHTEQNLSPNKIKETQKINTFTKMINQKDLSKKHSKKKINSFQEKIKQISKSINFKPKQNELSQENTHLTAKRNISRSIKFNERQEKHKQNKYIQNNENKYQVEKILSTHNNDKKQIIQIETHQMIASSAAHKGIAQFEYEVNIQDQKTSKYGKTELKAQQKSNQANKKINDIEKNQKKLHTVQKVQSNSIKQSHDLEDINQVKKNNSNIEKQQNQKQGKIKQRNYEISQFQQLNEEVNSLKDLKEQKENNLFESEYTMQKLTIDLEKIEKNIQSVSKQRLKTKQKISSKILSDKQQVNLKLD